MQGLLHMATSRALRAWQLVTGDSTAVIWQETLDQVPCRVDVGFIDRSCSGKHTAGLGETRFVSRP